MPTKKALREASDALAEKTIAKIIEHFPAMKRRETEKPVKVANHLHGLLSAICWRKSSITTTGDAESFKDYSKFLSAVSKDWTPDYHDEVVAYLDTAAYLEEIGTSGDIELETAIVDEMSDDQLLEELTKDLKPKAQLSPEHELDEIVAEAERQMNPTYKTW
jgi:hypothetical protein